jgi:hypothetical protein
VRAEEEAVVIEDARCVAETDKAILCKAEDFDGEDIWIPKSQVDVDSEVFAKGDTGKLVISAWFARKVHLA